ncbi:MAG: hypothetical protein HY036_08745 [Nitrospirae bacterium]|nr:hypothetical protein [Nitrospirota bacterium]
MSNVTTTISPGMDSNVFEQGILVQFSVSVWGGRIKLPSSDMHTEADPDFIRGTKYLVDRSYLKPVEQVRNSARSYLRSHSLPFPITSILFIPRDMINKIEAKLWEYKEEFLRQTDDFVAQFENAKRVAQLKLNGLFNEGDYPEEMSSRFEFNWKFFAVTAPGKMSILDPALLRREEERFVQMINDFRENAVSVLRLRFSEMVSRIVDRLSGEDKRFKNSTIGNIQEFLSCFDQLNINNDEELKREVERVKGILAGVDPTALRSNADFRIGIATQMTQVQDQLNTMMENRPKRLLWMEPEEETKAAA